MVEAGRPADFVPQKNFWIIIKHRRYDALRVPEHANDGWGNFQDIPYVDADAENAKRGFISLGANPNDITVKEDQSFEGLKKFFRSINNQVIVNWETHRQKSLVFVYYAGHGVMDNTVYAVCNGGPLNSKICYPLQSQLQSIAMLEGCYVLGIFDCCREKLRPAMRGGGPRGAEEDEGDDQNSVFWFGCKENA